MYAAAEAAQPITGRGIGYKLFTAGLIPSMERKEMQRVYRLLKEAREQGDIPWEWIVDETRAIERVSTWDDPEEYARVLRPGLSPRLLEPATGSRAGVEREGHRARRASAGARPVRGRLPRDHGFSSATAAHDVAEDDDGRDLIVLYVGDYDPSGMFMSEEDLPARFAKYDGDHVTLQRIALTSNTCADLPSFPRQPTSGKDPRYKWFVANYGQSLLGARRDGPQRSPQLRRGGDRWN